MALAAYGLTLVDSVCKVGALAHCITLGDADTHYGRVGECRSMGVDVDERVASLWRG